MLVNAFCIPALPDDVSRQILARTTLAERTERIQSLEIRALVDVTVCCTMEHIDYEGPEGPQLASFLFIWKTWC